MAYIHEIATNFIDSAGLTVPIEDGKVVNLPPVDLVVATSNAFRVNAISQWAETSGLKIVTRNVVNGWESERGETAPEKALDKVFHSAAKTLPFRRPDRITLIVAADSFNRMDGFLREKPRTLDQFMQFGDEWGKAQRQEESIGTEAGIGVLAMHRDTFSVVRCLDQVSLWPIMSSQSLRQYFREQNFLKAREVAHGLGIHPLIHAQEVKVTDSLSGVIDFSSHLELSPDEASQRVYGVAPQLIGRAVELALSQFEFA